MKAAVFCAPRKLSVETLPDPAPGPGQVVIQVERCGICGSDLHMTESHDVFPPGTVLGHEFAGEVVAVGSQVQALKAGDRVCAMPICGCGTCLWCERGEPQWCPQFQFNSGGYAQYALTAARACLKLPDILTPNDGALVEPMAVSRKALRHAQITASANVLVLGAGPIGLAAAYWSKRFGAKRVAVAATSRRRERLAEAVGADAFILNDENASQALPAVFGGLPEVIIECVGLPGTLARAVELAAPRGTVVMAGACNLPEQLGTLAASLKELRVQFSLLYSVEDFRASIEALGTDPAGLRAMITEVVGMAQFPTMFESLRERSPHCKVMLAPWT
jgi:(R,R)-butanediol dehydrogenase / meso-butanediol dehydrogenase / diacetyl reductase